MGADLTSLNLAIRGRLPLASQLLKSGADNIQSRYHCDHKGQ